MNKYYLISKETGEVKSVCDDIIGYDKTIFNLKKIKTTVDEDELIKQNYRIKFTDKLELEKPSYLKKKEDKENLKIQIDNAKNLPELKELIKTLL